jgi:hypothetical protein
MLGGYGMATTIIVSLISIAVGGFITFLVTRWYYDRASGDLEREAGELKDYTVMLVNYLDDAGVIEVERDAHSNPIRVRVIKREIADSVDVSDNVEDKFTREEVYQPREQNHPDS